MSDEQNLGKYAIWYAQQGWAIHPCHGINSGGKCTCGGAHSDPKDMGKHPALNSWNTAASTDPIQVASWWEDNPEYNVGVYCRPSGFFVVDIDPRSGGDESFLKFEAMVEGALPPTVQAETGVYSHKGKTVRGRHLYYKADQSEQLIGNLKALGLEGIDIKHNGYVLAPPSRHVSGVEYQWKAGHAPWEILMADAPEELLSGLRKRNRRTGGVNSSGGSTGRLSEVDWSSFKGIGDNENDRVDVEKILKEGLVEGERATGMYKLACAIANTQDVNTELGRQAVESLMIRFNGEKVRPPLHVEGVGGVLQHTQNAISFVQNNPKKSRHAEAEQWNRDAAKRIADGSFRNQTQLATTSDPDNLDDIYTAPGTLGAAVSSAASSGVSMEEATNLRNMDTPGDLDALTQEEGGVVGGRSLTDTGNGRRIVDSFGSVIRYTPGLGWFSWLGNHWQNDPENLNIREQAKKLSPIISSEAHKYDDNMRPTLYKWSDQSRSAARIDAAIKSATSDPRIRADVSTWDSNENLLGVANGVVDLRTGEVLKGRPDLHITRRSPISYTAGIKTPRWDKFIDDATGGDEELQEYIQRAVGYTLTGHSNHDVMFLVYGPPGSGKNTFVEAIVKCLGTSQYSWPMDSSILADKDGQSNSTDLYHWAELRGRRMVWVDELPDGERIKENAIKKLTGSSEISARSPGEKPFTFQSQAKLWLTTNHRPIITDDAMWRRIRPIPWSHVPKKPDPSLKEYLFDPEGGLPSILSWAVEGAIKFLSSPEVDGFGFSQAVQDAAEFYRKSEDRIGMFLNEETVEEEAASIEMRQLYNIYRTWSEERGERALTQIAFVRKLRDRGMSMSGEGSRIIVNNRQRAIHIPNTPYPSTPAASSDIDWNNLGYKKY